MARKEMIDLFDLGFGLFYSANTDKTPEIIGIKHIADGNAI